MKTKTDLQFEKAQLERKLKAINEELEKMETVLNVPGDKAYSRYSLSEANDLYNISKKAWEWFQDSENQNATIDDYNAVAGSAYRVKLQ